NDARSRRNYAQHRCRRLGDHNPCCGVFGSSGGWISDSSTSVRGKTTQGLPGPESADRIDASLSCREKKRRAPTRRKEKRRTVPLVSGINASQALFDAHSAVLGYLWGVHQVHFHA
ncbi:hypothetical protein NDU88_002147, partial [Pleurodeles waltl]